MVVEEAMGAAKVQLVKWGNSHAVRLPKSVLPQANIRGGDQLDISVENGRIALQPATPRLALSDLVARMTPRNIHREPDWGGRAGSEVW